MRKELVKKERVGSQAKNKRSRVKFARKTGTKTAARQCVCCRVSEDKKKLIRIAFEESGFYLDFLQEGRGRAWYVHATNACLQKKRFESSFLKAVRKVVHEKKNFIDAMSAYEKQIADERQIANLKMLFERGRHKISQMIFTEDVSTGVQKDHGKKNKKYTLAKVLMTEVEQLLNQAELTHSPSGTGTKKRIRL